MMDLLTFGFYFFIDKHRYEIDLRGFYLNKLVDSDS